MVVFEIRQMAEDEEVRRLRKELVPKAQPMPYFDRPFIPRRYIEKLFNFHLRNLRLMSFGSLNWLVCSFCDVCLKVSKASNNTKRTKIPYPTAEEDQVLLVLE